MQKNTVLILVGLITSFVRPYDVRIATPNDLDQIVHVHYASWHSTYDHIFEDDYRSKNTKEYLKQHWNKFFEKQQHDNRFVLVATSDDKIIGIISAGPIKIDKKEPCGVADLFEREGYDSEIYKLYLLPVEQKKGLGKTLLQKTLDQLKIRGFKKLIIRAFTQNESACSFYQHVGARLLFSITHSTQIPYRIYGLDHI